MKRKWVMGMSVVLLTMVLGGCGTGQSSNKAEESDSGSPESTETVTEIPTEEKNPEETQNTSLPGKGELITAALTGEVPEDSEDEMSLRSSLEENGWRSDVEYAGNDAAIQELILKNQISMGPALLFVEPIDTASLTTDLEDAGAEGIIRVFWKELAENTEAIDYYLGFDEEKAGFRQGEIIKNLIQEKETLRIAFLTEKESYVNRTRWSGLMDSLTNEFLEGKLIYDSGSGNFEEYRLSCSGEEELKKAIGDKVKEDYVSRQPDIICCLDDALAELLMEAYQEEGINTENWPVIIGCGGSDRMLELADDQKIFTVKEDEEALLEAAVELTEGLLNGEKPKNLTEIDNGVKSVPALLVSPDEIK